MTTQDPIQGLIDFVNEIKPFHTKVLEVAIAYAQSDDVDIVFTEEFEMEISMFWPALADDDDVPIQNCLEGWGEVWDRQSPYIVIDANLSPQTITVDGDQTDFFDVGTRFEIREPTIDDGSPTTQNTPRVAELLTLSVAYDATANTTIIGVTRVDEGWLGSPIVWVGSPIISAVDNFLVVNTTGTFSAGNETSGSLPNFYSAAEYESRYGSVGADAVHFGPFSSAIGGAALDPCSLPVWANRGSPVSETTISGKYYVEINMIDVRGVTNDRPSIIFGRPEPSRREFWPNSGSYHAGTGVWYARQGRIGDGTGVALSVVYDNNADSYTTGDTVNVAIDFDNQKCWFGKNGVWQGTGTQDPDTNQGGFWPTDFGVHAAAGVTEQKVHFCLQEYLDPGANRNLNHNLPIDEAGSPRADSRDVVAWRYSEDNWVYTPPVGFEQWTTASEPNTAAAGAYQWVDPNTQIGANGAISFDSYGDRPIVVAVTADGSGNNSGLYYTLDRSNTNKYYAEITSFQLQGGDLIFIPTNPVYGSPGPSFETIFEGKNKSFWFHPTSFGLRASGFAYANGSTFGGGSSSLWDDAVFTSLGHTSNTQEEGDTHMIAMDFDSRKFWIGGNGRWQNGIIPGVGSPVGGYDISVGSPIAWRASFTSDGGNLANLGGAEFNYTPPTGFLPFAYEPAGGSGSPLTPPSGSPPFSGNEFWFPPYQTGAISNGDAFVIYNVVETSEIRIITRPTPFYVLIGSPIGSGSPYTVGSPLPGSPKIVTGSPATLYGSPWAPIYGSPTLTGNTITIEAISTAPFIYGREVEIRNASEPSLNKTYNILRAVDLGGSPELIELTLIDPVSATTTNDGELVFTPRGWSGGDLCSDIPPELAQTHWMEQLDQTWRFTGSPNLGLRSAFQFFILEADSTNNTVTVQGDVRSTLSLFGSPAGGSPISIPASIQHSIEEYGSPFFRYETQVVIHGSPADLLHTHSVRVGSPFAVNANNGAKTISNVTYNVTTNRSIIFVDSISANTPTGWIIST